MVSRDDPAVEVEPVGTMEETIAIHGANSYCRKDLCPIVCKCAEQTMVELATGDAATFELGIVRSSHKSLFRELAALQSTLRELEEELDVLRRFKDAVQLAYPQLRKAE